jgi:hypothetical protein
VAGFAGLCSWSPALAVAGGGGATKGGSCRTSWTLSNAGDSGAWG